MVRVASHFLDSGAFSLRRKAKGSVDYKAYIDRYAEFVKEHHYAVDLYANVDVIGDPALTYANQNYLENEHGLRPVPVVHYGTDPVWVDKYLDDGHDLIGLGGLVGNTRDAADWLDRCFDVMCPNGMPVCRAHGFGVANHRLLTRYPWYSVDSSAWIQEAGKWGGVFLPYWRNGAWDFSNGYYRLIVDGKSKRWTRMGGLSDAEKAELKRWLDSILVPLGDDNAPGVVNDRNHRARANLLFFEGYRKNLPGFPRPFDRKPAGLLWGTAGKFRKAVAGKVKPLKVYYSGQAGSTDETPEKVFGNDAYLMFSFYDHPNPRMDAVLAGRAPGVTK